MFGFLKNLIGERGERPSESAAPATPAESASPAAPVPPAPVAPQEKEKAKTETPESGGAGKTVRPVTAHSGRVLISLKAITDKFPAPLKATLAAPPEGATQISLKLDELLPQLPSGRVEITLRELRQAAPIGTFVADTSRDGEKVSIPLSELLPRIDSTLLQTRSQQRVEVPEDIETPFRKQGASGTTTKIISKESEAPAAPANKLAPGIQAPSEIQALFGASAKKNVEAQASVDEGRVTMPIPSAPATPAAESSQGLRMPSIPAAPAVPIPVAPVAPVPAPAVKAATAPLLAPIQLSLTPSSTQSIEPDAFPTSSPAPEPVAPPPAPSASGSGPILSRRGPIVDSPLPSAKLSTPSAPLRAPSGPIPAPAPVSSAPLAPPASPVRSEGKASVIAIPLGAVSKGWPEAIREEVIGAAPDAVIEYPASDLEAALKGGKVSVQWARLRSWVRPAAGLGRGSLYDDAMVELPLSVVAPLFMAASSSASAASRSKLTVDESMPALFQSAKAAAAAQAAAEPEKPVSRPIPIPARATTGAGAEGLDGGRVPSVLIERACALRGVAGAVVALSDGLLVAASVPEEFTADTIAAFLPQVFSKLEQAAGSMQIGEVQHLSFTAADRAWQIWRAGDLFFAAIGIPQEMLPGAQLKILAAQLARQTRG